MGRPRPITTCDSETDPFLKDRIPKPFIWGFYDGKNFLTFSTTREFIQHIKTQRIICYAHNGGKFDFMFLLEELGDEFEGKMQIINGRIISMHIGECEFIDSYAAVPQALGTIKKKQIKMWKLEASVRDQHMVEIKDYLWGDCVYLHELMVAYRQTAGTKKTIASNALTFANKLGIDIGKSNFRFDSSFRPYFFGGRTQCFQPGTFKNIRVYDIHSAYPYAMMHDHATGGDLREWFTQDDFRGMTNGDVERSFITLECFAEGCFPKRNFNTEGLSFPHTYDEYNITGWEYRAALQLNLIRNITIKSVCYTKNTITFKPYVVHWYDYKNSYDKETDPIHYTIGKIMMNSLYGKTAQNALKYCDYKIVRKGTDLPCREAIIDKTNEEYCYVCRQKIMDHGWDLYSTYFNHEFWVRESMWKNKFLYGEDWEAKKVFKNVAIGASITGFVRAHLLRAIYSVGYEHVIYCDTDSLICTPEHNRQALPQSSSIGDWGIDVDNAPIGHFASKKLYAIDIAPHKPCHCADLEEPCERHKVVTKGAKLTFKEMEKVAAGQTVLYQSNTPSFSIARGKTFFIERKIRMNT